jgi:hypothetical protein
VSLGGLRLRSGDAGSALAQFDAFLRGGGRLEAEALFGAGGRGAARSRRDEVDNGGKTSSRVIAEWLCDPRWRRLDQLR